MKKLTALLLCLVMCVSMFAACGDDTPADTTRPTPTTTGKAPSTSTPDTTPDTTPNGDETTTQTEVVPNVPKDLEDLIPEMPEDEKLAIEDLGAKNPGQVETGHLTLGEKGISSLAEIDDPAGSYYLTTDISANETTLPWFSGLLDCCGYTITTSVPLFMELTGTVYNLKLAGDIAVNEVACAPLAIELGSGATVFNVLNSVNVTVGETDSVDIKAGGFAITAYGENILFANCEYSGHIQNELKLDSNGRIVGGFVAEIIPPSDEESSSVSFIYCTSSGSIVASSFAGGLVGNVVAPADTVYGGCLNKAPISVNHGGDVAVGGLVGGISKGKTSTTYFFNCANDATLFNMGLRLGGILGSSYNDSILAETYFTWCVNYKELNSHSYIGGIAGNVVGFANYDSCINFGDLKTKYITEVDLTVRKDVYIGGIVSTMSNSNSLKCGFTDCVNYGNIEVNGTNNYFAGILARGDNVYAVLTRCVNFGDLKSLYQYVESYPQNGRFAGLVASIKYFEAYDSVNFGDIDISVNANNIQVGGILGLLPNGDEGFPTIIKNCMNYGSVVATEPPASYIENKNVMPISSSGIIGFIQNNAAPLTVTGCINAGTITGFNSVADLILWNKPLTDIPTEGNDLSNTYYLGNMYTGTKLYAPVICNFKGNTSNAVNGGDIVTFLSDMVKSFTADELKDATSVGLAGKMNTTAGEELFKCVTVKLDAAENRICVVPVAILGLIEDYIVG